MDFFVGILEEKVGWGLVISRNGVEGYRGYMVIFLCFQGGVGIWRDLDSLEQVY